MAEYDMHVKLNGLGEAGRFLRLLLLNEALQSDHGKGSSNVACT